MNIEIVNGRIIVEGRETINPEMIGYAVLDAVENGEVVMCEASHIDEVVTKAFNAGFKASEALKGVQIGSIKAEEKLKPKEVKSFRCPCGGIVGPMPHRCR